MTYYENKIEIKNKRKERCGIINPNYNIMLDSYVTKCKTTYEEYKRVLILLITYTSINNKGRLVYYEGSLIKKLEEKRKAFNEAIEQLNNFKELNSEFIDDCVKR